MSNIFIIHAFGNIYLAFITQIPLYSNTKSILSHTHSLILLLYSLCIQVIDATDLSGNMILFLATFFMALFSMEVRYSPALSIFSSIVLFLYRLVLLLTQYL